MNQAIFQQAPLSNRSFMQRLLGQQPQENAVIKLNNLLASRPVKEISYSDILEIENRYGFAIGHEFKLNVEEFYATYLNHCLSDKTLSEEELQDLKHLKQLLSLDNTTIHKLHTQIGEVVYKKSFEEAVADGRLTKEEEAFLGRLSTDLQLPKQLAEKISAETRTAFMQNYVTGIISDERLSPEEESELQAIAGSLNINLELDEKTKNQLQKLKLYWALENLDLPILQPDIILQKSEQCYFQIEGVNWYELRTVRQKVNYSGYSTSFKIAKGFYLRSGSYNRKSYSVDEMKLIDKGSLYLTNKRIIFTGLKKNSNIRLDKIINTTPHLDGVEIDKETGKSPLLRIPERVDVFCLMLERLVKG